MLSMTQMNEYFEPLRCLAKIQQKPADQQSQESVEIEQKVANKRKNDPAFMFVL